MSEELVPTEQAADVSGAGESAGTPEVQEAAPDTTGSPIPTGQESEGITEDTGEGAGNLYDSPPAEERIQQLANKTRELEERLLRQQQEQQQERPDYAPDQQILEVKRQIALATNRISELQEDIRLDPENSLEQAMELADLQSRIPRAFQWMQEQAQKRQEFEQRKQQGAQQEQYLAQVNQQLNEAAELVRQDRKVTPEVWQKGEQWVQAQRSAKPLLDAKYREMVHRHGPVAAVEWAEQYVQTNMGKQFAEATAAKEAAKLNIPAGKSGSDDVFKQPTDKRSEFLSQLYPSMTK